MDKLLIKGRYSTYSNYGGKNIPMEEKRDMREDASWSVEGYQSSPFPNQQAADIFYEQKYDRGVIITHNDIIKKQIGKPTHPIVEALLSAEYQYQIDREIMKTHGRKSWLEHIFAPSDFSIYEPSDRGALITGRKLKELTNEELLKIMFDLFRACAKDYCKSLENHFIYGNGRSNYITLEKWPDRIWTRLNALLKAIRDKIWTAYKGSITQDITDEISANWVDFSGIWLMLGEWMAFGGIQEVELNGYLSSVKETGKKTILNVRLEFIIKDWFGVDEEDVYKDSKATQVARDALAAFWILQHQRGYKPFINRISYTETKEYIF